MTRRANNILFIMCDQLRWDYLSSPICWKPRKQCAFCASIIPSIIRQDLAS
jgi:hypothetical protein